LGAERDSCHIPDPDDRSVRIGPDD
jgi:hypothetical protein